MELLKFIWFLLKDFTRYVFEFLADMGLLMAVMVAYVPVSIYCAMLDQWEKFKEQSK